MNDCFFTGRLMKDPELSKTKNGKDVLYAMLSVKHYSGGWKVAHVNCVFYARNAKNVVEHCKKGQLLNVKTTLNTVAIEKGDTKEYAYFFVVSKVEFLPSDNEALVEAALKATEGLAEHADDLEGMFV